MTINTEVLTSAAKKLDGNRQSFVVKTVGIEFQDAKGNRKAEQTTLSIGRQKNFQLTSICR